MSTFSNRIDCNSVHSNIALFIDNEIEDQNLYHEVEIHVGLCPSCKDVLIREQENLRQLKALLGAACCETVSDTFQAQLLEQIALVAQEQHRQAQQSAQSFADLGGFYQSQAVITTSYTHTEIIEDGELHIQIETTHEIREEY